MVLLHFVFECATEECISMEQSDQRSVLQSGIMYIRYLQKDQHTSEAKHMIESPYSDWHTLSSWLKIYGFVMHVTHEKPKTAT